MKIHRNAKTCPNSRRLLVERINSRTWSLRAAAAAAVGSRTRPAFDATDPGSYTGWSPYDEAIASAQARGIRVLMTPTGPTPDWASQCAPKATNRWRCRPRPSDYGALVRALGARYSGVFSAG